MHVKALLLATALGGTHAGATLEYHNGNYDIGCGNGMYVLDAGCGMDSKVEGIIEGSWESGCDLCLRILEQDGWFEGCEGTARCVASKGLFGRNDGIWLKALPAPSPPSPPSLPPPDFPPPPMSPNDVMFEICGELEKDVCQKRMAIGAAGAVILVGVVALASRSSGGATPLV